MTRPGASGTPARAIGMGGDAGDERTPSGRLRPSNSTMPQISAVVFLFPAQPYDFSPDGYVAHPFGRTCHGETTALRRPPHTIHHVINRDGSKRTIFGSKADYRFFLALLAREVCAGRTKVTAYPLLTTHLHLVLRSVNGEL